MCAEDFVEQRHFSSVMTFFARQLLKWVDRASCRTPSTDDVFAVCGLFIVRGWADKQGQIRADLIVFAVTFRLASITTAATNAIATPTGACAPNKQSVARLTASVASKTVCSPVLRQPPSDASRRSPGSLDLSTLYGSMMMTC
jgi:hypothetical protein